MRKSGDWREEGCCHSRIFRRAEQGQVWLPREIHILSCHHRKEEGLDGDGAGENSRVYVIQCLVSLDFICGINGRWLKSSGQNNDVVRFAGEKKSLWKTECIYKQSTHLLASGHWDWSRHREIAIYVPVRLSISIGIHHGFKELSKSYLWAYACPWEVCWGVLPCYLHLGLTSSFFLAGFLQHPIMPCYLSSVISRLSKTYSNPEESHYN